MLVTLFWSSLAVELLSLLVVVPAVIAYRRGPCGHNEPD